MLKEVKTCPEACKRAKYVEYADAPDSGHYECEYRKNVGHLSVIIDGRVLCRRIKRKDNRE